MARRLRRESQLAFEALTIEGGLLSPEWLAKVAQLEAPQQAAADYGIEKGLQVRDEIGRYWRIAEPKWRDFAAARSSGADPRAAASTFVSELLTKVFGFDSLKKVGTVTAGERMYPLGWSALEAKVPVVIAGPLPVREKDSALDELAEEFGDETRRRTPFGLCQEFLNASDGAMWGIVSDGLTLRVLRDNVSLTRPAWLEADLQAIFTGGRFSDFAALWLLLHQSRFGRLGQPPAECPLEQWRSLGREEGTRAREQLREGVEAALRALGQGFLSHRDNQALRVALEKGELTEREYFQQLLRLVYRLIFVLTVEERGLLHPDGTPDAAKALYSGGYALRGLRERVVRRSAHDRNHDAWEAAKVVFRGLATGQPALGLPALAGIFAPVQCRDLDAGRIENRYFLQALYRLSWLQEAGGLARVNWRDMGPEELGSVYESLLELTPRLTKEGREFTFAEGAEGKGHARKTTGSYYTPDSLVQVLLDSALNPVMDRAEASRPNAKAEALLELTIVDPACGSGHFLLAAARRLAARVAQHEAKGTASPKEYRHALRRVVGRCIFGVDLNPLAVELCKVGLWMEAVEPGLPLTFLDSHVQCGNALLGTTPGVMNDGIPDDAWAPIGEDDKKAASALKKRNKVAKNQSSLPLAVAKDESRVLVKAVTALDAAKDTDVMSLAKKEADWSALQHSRAFEHQKLVADMWSSAFVWPKPATTDKVVEVAPTEDLWRQVRDAQLTPPRLLVDTVGSLATEYQFFHWQLAFPQVFERGGFDVVLGNPPWEELTPSAKEFFGVYEPEIWSQDKAGEEGITTELLKRPEIAGAWTGHCRRLFGTIHWLKNSGRHVLFAPGNLGKGDFNVYRMFVETALRSVRTDGIAAQIVPDTMYSGANTMAIREQLFARFEWRLLLGFDNGGEAWFAGVHKSAKFCLYAARCGGKTVGVRVAFGIRSGADLARELAEPNPVRLSSETVRSFSPEALAIMEVRSAEDLELAVRMHRAWPPFGVGGAQPVHRHMRELDMTNDSALFQSGPPGLPVYEGRMVGPYDHRAKGYRSGKARSAEWDDFAFGDRAKSILPQFYVREADLPEKLGGRPFTCRVGYCNIASPLNERTLVATLIPPNVVCGNKVPTISFDEGFDWYAACWVGVANSFAVDFLARKKVSLTMTNTIIDSLPIPRISPDDARARRLVPLVARLCCVGPEMQSYWDCLRRDGWVGTLDTSADGLIDLNERARLEAEVDALVALEFFRLSRSDLERILSAFPVVEKRDRKAFGEYRTKLLILERYDALAEASGTGKYETPLSPTPAHDSWRHPLRRQ
ncbi:MAG: N-6 DNA methylase [Myxococcaceae bacterium]